MESLSKFIGAVVTLLLLLVYGPLVGGLIVYKFYTWFVISAFVMLPVISYWQAVGIAFFIAFVRGFRSTSIAEKYQKDKNEQMVTSLVTPWGLLLAGWIFHLITS